MRNKCGVLLGLLVCAMLSACAGPDTAQPTASPNTSQEQSDMNEKGSLPSDERQGSATASPSASPAAAERKLVLNIDGQEISVTLYDTPAANALYARLPLTLTFEDFNGTEKISYPPDAIPTEGEPDGCDPQVGDLCLYAPWGNLCIFYQDFPYSDGLIKLGHIDSHMDVIRHMNEDFSATLTRAAASDTR